MGRRNRERIERIRRGEEQPIATQRTLNNPVARTAVKLTSRGDVVRELSKGSVSDQTGRLDELVGTGALGASRLKRAIMSKAPKEMDKAIKKFRKQGKNIIVDSLCAEIRSEPSFLKMCANVGLTVEWFEELARERMRRQGIKEGE